MRSLVILVGILLLAGCSYNETFVYKPSASVARDRPLPVKVAVVTFRDGTEDFTKRGSILTGGYFNLAKSGYSGMITALPPQLWAKFFAEELNVSGSFRSTRVIFDVSEAAEDEVIVEGTVMKAYFAIYGTDPSRFALVLSARTGRSGRPFWEKSVSRDAALGKGYGEGCGMDVQCSIDLTHGHHNRMMQELFAEARAGLVRALEPAPGSGGMPSEASPMPLPTAESVEETIENIFKGNGSR